MDGKMDSMSVAICGESELFREGVASVLQAQDVKITKLATNLYEILAREGASCLPDVVILGVGDDSDLQTQVGILSDAPMAHLRLIVLARVPSADLINAATDTGVQAVLSANISGKVLRRALELVMLGQQVFPAPMRDSPARPAEPMLPISTSGILLGETRPAFSETSSWLELKFSNQSGEVQLSEREEQILCRLVSGAPNKTIARELKITDATVKVHIKGLLRKLRVNNRTQAAIWGLNHGYFGESPQRFISVTREAERMLNGVS